MFSNEDRCLYSKSPLAEVICQLRFPQILIIGTQVPAEFQETIRDEFPQYIRRQEAPAPKVTGLGSPNARLEQSDRAVGLGEFYAVICASLMVFSSAS